MWDIIFLIVGIFIAYRVIKSFTIMWKDYKVTKSIVKILEDKSKNNKEV